MLIIDCHGHYTTAPEPHQKFREAQLVRIKDSTLPAPVPQQVSDDEIREIDRDQPASSAARARRRPHACSRRVPRPWGITWAMSPFPWRGRAPATTSSSASWICTPTISSASASLPQSPGVPISHSIRELVRCVRDLGFVGCNLNPDPSGGHWNSPPLTDRHWYPFYEKMVELDVPAMIHVSASCNPNFHATGAHYINADTTAFMQFIQGDLFRDFPDASLRHPAWRRSRAVSLGALSRSCRHAQAPGARRACHAKCVLRHLRVPPAGHRSAREGDRHRQHSVWLGNAGRGARHRSANRTSLRRYQALHRCARGAPPTPSARSSSSTCDACIRGWTRSSRRGACEGLQPISGRRGLAQLSRGAAQACVPPTAGRGGRALPRVRTRRRVSVRAASASTRQRMRPRKSYGRCATSWGSSAT